MVPSSVLIVYYDRIPNSGNNFLFIMLRNTVCVCYMCNRVSQGRKKRGGREGGTDGRMDRTKISLGNKRKEAKFVPSIYLILQKASVTREAINYIRPLFLAKQLAIFGETFLHREQLRNS